MIRLAKVGVRASGHCRRRCSWDQINESTCTKSVDRLRRVKIDKLSIRLSDLIKAVAQIWSQLKEVNFAEFPGRQWAWSLGTRYTNRIWGSKETVYCGSSLWPGFFVLFGIKWKIGGCLRLSGTIKRRNRGVERVAIRRWVPGRNGWPRDVAKSPTSASGEHLLPKKGGSQWPSLRKRDYENLETKTLGDEISGLVEKESRERLTIQSIC